MVEMIFEQEKSAGKQVEMIFLQEMPRTAGVLLMGTGGSAPPHSTTYFEVTDGGLEYELLAYQ